jgi:hypothetical protein
MINNEPATWPSRILYETNRKESDRANPRGVILHPKYTCYSYRAGLEPGQTRICLATYQFILQSVTRYGVPNGTWLEPH